MSNCPPVWLCQLLRQAGSKVTLDTGQFKAPLLVSGARYDCPMK